VVDQDSVLSRRDVSGLVVARVGRVASTDDPVTPWVVLDGAGTPVEPVVQFLRDLLACGSSPASCRSYGFDLLRWLRFLATVDVQWPRAQRGAAGAVNPRTGKTPLRAGYIPATINHAVSVLSAFYDFHLLSVNGGLPIHIAAKLLGHLDLNTTQGYVAVYPQEVIRHYRRFVDQRRATRPSEEYREPTDARQMQWLGEVSGLQDSLRHLADKKQLAERLRQLSTNSDGNDQDLG